MDAWHPIAICNLWRIYHQHCWSMHNLETPGGTNNITQTNPYYQRHWIFFPTDIFFLDCKTDCFCCGDFFPHTNHHWWSGFVITFSVGHCPARSQDSPSKSARLHRTLISLLESFDYDQPEEENQPIDGIQDQSFFSCKSIVLLIIQLSTVWMND